MTLRQPARFHPTIFTTQDVPLGRRWLVYRDLGILLIAADLSAIERQEAFAEFHATPTPS